MRAPPLIRSPFLPLFPLTILNYRHCSGKAVPCAASARKRKRRIFLRFFCFVKNSDHTHLLLLLGEKRTFADNLCGRRSSFFSSLSCFEEGISFRSEKRTPGTYMQALRKPFSPLGAARKLAKNPEEKKSSLNLGKNGGKPSSLSFFPTAT